MKYKSIFVEFMIKILYFIECTYKGKKKVILEHFCVLSLFFPETDKWTSLPPSHPTYFNFKN